MNRSDDNMAEAPTTLSWVAADGSDWRIELPPDAIVLSDGGDPFTLPVVRWPRDLYVAAHGDGFIIRIETDTRSVGFLVTAEQAAPFLNHVQRRVPIAAMTPSVATEQPSRSRDELLWPRVSPLAVWALCTSSLAFLPVIGVVLATAATVLLILHRVHVRRAAAYRHSRALCTVAFILTLSGVAVSALGTWGLLSLASTPNRGLPTQFERADVLRSEPASAAEHAAVDAGSPGRSAHPDRLLRAGLFDEVHNWPLIVAGLFAVLFSLTVHEAAHAITAWWLGDDLARRLGRVTLNPLAHVDPIGTIVLPLILFLSGVGVFGWARPVPVEVHNLPRPRRAHILIALAGPGSNLLIAAASMMLLIAIGCLVRILAPAGTITNLTELNFDATVSASGFVLAPIVGPLCTILQMSFLVNVFLAFFNLIPVPPLDGSWVLEHTFPRRLGPLYARLRPYSFLLFVGLLYTGVLGYLIAPAVHVIHDGFTMLSLCTGF